MPLTNGGDNNYFGTSILSTDTSFFSTFEIKLLAGRLFKDHERMAFRRGDKVELIPVLVNEEFVKNLGFKTLDEAIEQRVNFYWGPEQRFAKIIGVVANHHQVSMKESIQPIVCDQPEWIDAKYFAAQTVAGANISINDIQSAYTKAFPGHSFTYFFLDEHFDQQLASQRSTVRKDLQHVYSARHYRSACLGLIGLSIFSVTQRTKEVSIRKVLGAPASNPVSILTRFHKGIADLLRYCCASYLLGRRKSGFRISQRVYRCDGRFSSCH